MAKKTGLAAMGDDYNEDYSKAMGREMPPMEDEMPEMDTDMEAPEELSPEEQGLVDEVVSEFGLDEATARKVFDFLWDRYKELGSVEAPPDMDTEMPMGDEE